MNQGKHERMLESVGSMDVVALRPSALTFEIGLRSAANSRINNRCLPRLHLLFSGLRLHSCRDVISLLAGSSRSCKTLEETPGRSSRKYDQSGPHAVGILRQRIYRYQVQHVALRNQSATARLERSKAEALHSSRCSNMTWLAIRTSRSLKLSFCSSAFPYPYHS